MPDKGELVLQEIMQRMAYEPRPLRLHPTVRGLELLGDPGSLFDIIHITGTNGKTSTSRIAESLVRAHNLRTGLFTSPHLTRVNERIQIDGQPISDEKLWENWQDIQWALGVVDEELAADGQKPLSFFEVLTLLGAACFADAPVDVVILEVGMGGEWDSTNALDGDVAVFTPISIDHASRLGNTLDEIATTKSGIMKPGAVAVSARQADEALVALQRKADALEVPLVVQDDDFAVTNITTAIGGQLVTIRGRAGSYAPMFLPLFGDHQAQNAAVALAAVELLLGQEGEMLDADIVAEGLNLATSPGRLQMIHHQPSILVDAAHNPSGATVLAQALVDYFSFEKVIAILAVMGDKDIDGIFAALQDRIDHAIITHSSSERSANPEDLRELAEDYFSEVTVAENLREAVILGHHLAEETPDAVLLVTGSIILVGEVTTLVKELWPSDGE